MEGDKGSCRNHEVSYILLDSTEKWLASFQFSVGLHLNSEFRTPHFPGSSYHHSNLSFNLEILSMRAVIQRVRRASVTIDGSVVGQINQWLLVIHSLMPLGVEHPRVK